MMSYDQNMQIVGGRRLVFVPYPEGLDEVLYDCNHDTCALRGRYACGLCTRHSRDDKRGGWWRCVDA